MSTKNQALEVLKEQTRFYLSTPDRVAEAMLFVKSAETYIKELKEKVKERGVEIMDKANVEAVPFQVVDPDTGEVKDYLLRRDYSKESKEYRPENVIAAIGEETAVRFLKVGKTDLEKYLKLASAKGEITMAQVEQAVAYPVIKTIKGSGVKLTPVK